MLPARHRLRDSADFSAVVKRGVRAGRNTVVIHLVTGSADSAAGLVVSRAIGGAVKRNLVKRRLRSIVAPIVESAPEGTRIVVRALAPASSSSYETLERDVHGAYMSAMKKVSQ